MVASLLKFGKNFYHEWQETKSPRMAAAITYYTLFSIAPLFVVALSITRFFFNPEVIQGEILSLIGNTLGPNSAQFLKTIANNIFESRSDAIIPLISFAISLYGASNVFRQLQFSFNVIFEAHNDQENGLSLILKRRGLTFLMVIGVGFLLITSLIASTIFQFVIRSLNQIIPIEISNYKIIDPLSSFLLVALLFGAIYKVLPAVELRWGPVWLGAILVSTFYNIGKYLLSLYFSTTSFRSIYGAAGSLMVFLVWMNISLQILLGGAVFIKVISTQKNKTDQSFPLGKSL